METGVPSTISGPFFLRAGLMWQKIEDWCDRSGEYGHEIKSSLLPGRPVYPNASNANLSAFQAVYAFYSGQNDRMVPRCVTGLFGGFQIYDVISNTRWMQPDLYDSQDFVVIAQCSMKAIAIQVSTGQIYSISRRNPNLVATPCPGGIHQRSDSMGLIREMPVDINDGMDSILRWFEEYAHRLHKNHYAVGILNPEDDDDRNDNVNAIHSLLKYPTVNDTVNCSRAVTRGVEIVASAIFVEEMGMFVYSIRMRLLTPDDGDGYMTPEQRGFDTCQLVSRHWKISKVRSVGPPAIDEVRGEGVIGYFPILCDGGFVRVFGNNMQYQGRGRGAFSYQSCTDADCPGAIEGSLQFTPKWGDGRPNGDTFNARVDPFPLTFSHFLY
ncbi:hypothetical protein ACHAXA_005401 [Cyclostephanos tholiformis]|uniref:ApaG domain-containing protein n=1 Tax=Cyclostephanos tholiformis TaxID=382380 RepID=A0ABD3RE68_9STRA